MQASFRTPVVLEGRAVRLEPLQQSHVPALIDIGLDPEIWRWSPQPLDIPRPMSQTT